MKKTWFETFFYDFNHLGQDFVWSLLGKRATVEDCNNIFGDDASKERTIAEYYVKLRPGDASLNEATRGGWACCIDDLLKVL